MLQTNSRPSIIAMMIVAMLPLVGCSCRPAYREDLDYSHNVVQIWRFDELMYREITQFDGVAFTPDLSKPLRKLIVEDQIVADRKVLQIGVGVGLVAILCLENAANSVVAIDSSSIAIANARYNAANIDREDKLETRTFDPGSDPFAQLYETEVFDLVLIDLTQTDALPALFFDVYFDGLKKHLGRGDRAIFIVDRRDNFIEIKERSEHRGFKFKLLDDVKLEILKNEFPASVLIEIQIPIEASVRPEQS